MNRRWHPWVGLSLVVLLGGCAGDGSELDDVMNPGGIEPTLASIQQNVFGAICIECHVPGGPGPMPLDSEQASYDNLVNVQSIEIGALLRVDPDDPENSYLVHKIEGRASIVGNRMPPPPRAMLTLEQITAIRDWISDGAPRGNGVTAPTLDQVQNAIFGTICIACHFPGGPGPMPLHTADASFASLVDVDSIEIPTLKRVAPGDSENSYIIHKVEGRATILGNRMPPPPRSMLTVEQIAMIRDWIDGGAQR